MYPFLNLGAPAGIPLRIHWTFWLLPVWVLAWYWHADSWLLAFQIGLLFAMFVCVVLHEFGHAWAARAFGIRTVNVTLYPIGGVAQLERMSTRPLQEIVVALAGPAVNLVIAALLLATLWSGVEWWPELFAGTLTGHFLWMLMVLNGLMIAFNLIPAFPLDGGRVLRGLLTRPLGLLGSTRFAAWLGGVVALTLGTLGAWHLGNPFLLVIGLFIVLAGQHELAMIEMQHRLARARRLWPQLFDAALAPETDTRPSSAAMPLFVYDAQQDKWVYSGSVSPPAS